VTWDKKMVDLGKVKKGEKRTLFFELTNTSGQEILIEIVDACECTKVDFPRGPIAAGSKGHFDVVFDSSEKDAPETIGINIVFRETDAAGNPRIETVEYKFEIEK
jgi:peptidoglycan-associated lipoprotein